MKFFIPNLLEEQYESKFIEFKNFVTLNHFDALDDRIYRLDFRHNGIEYTAKVGEEINVYEFPTQVQAIIKTMPTSGKPMYVIITAASILGQQNNITTSNMIREYLFSVE